MITVIEGEQRGDEGKGRFVDMLAPEFDIIARFNGGPNAGHTVVTPEGKEYALHVVPSGITHEGVMSVIGNGVLIDAPKLTDEIDSLAKDGIGVDERRLKISGAAHLILPHHIWLDEIREGGQKAQGSTKSGIAPAAAARAMREGLRAEIIKKDPIRLEEAIRENLNELQATHMDAGWDEVDTAAIAMQYVARAEKLIPFITDTSYFLGQALKQGKRILAEGAQAFLLDPDHGMYPFVTSTTPGASGVSPGLGVPPTSIDHVIGVVKATQSHVGGGPFVTEIHDKPTLDLLHGDMTTTDAEKGTTTGRIRRLGHFDLPGIRRAQMVNGTTEMALTKLDWVQRYGDTILVCTAYERKGRILDIAPDAAYKLDESTPIYTQLPGWEEDISRVRHFEDLPKAAQTYINFIEHETGVPITMIGVGYQRDQVIDRR